MRPVKIWSPNLFVDQLINQINAGFYSAMKFNSAFNEIGYFRDCETFIVN